VIHAVNQVPANQKTSTEKITEALDHLLGVGDREQELRRRDDLTEAERAELLAFGDAREEEREQKYQARRLELAGK
jgi:hypothetical protein